MKVKIKIDDDYQIFDYEGESWTSPLNIPAAVFREFAVHVLWLSIQNRNLHAKHF